MKKILIAIAALAFAGVVQANGNHHQPQHFVLNDVVAGQVNVHSGQTAIIDVIANNPAQIIHIGKVNLDATAVGNNISVDGSYDTVRSVQANSRSSQKAIVTVANNPIAGKVTIAATAVGNNLDVALDTVDVRGCVTGACNHANHVSALQVNVGSSQLAKVTVVNNNFGSDPLIDATAVGNNINGVGIIGSFTGQGNFCSPQLASVTFNRNFGLSGPLTINATAVGNNLSLSNGI